MVRLKGFTIIETLIAMSLFGTAVFVSNILIQNIYKQPNRSDLIQINQCIQKISKLNNFKEFEAEISNIEFDNLQITYDIEHLKNTDQCNFYISKNDEVIFSHFIILRHES